MGVGVEQPAPVEAGEADEEEVGEELAEEAGEGDHETFEEAVKSTDHPHLMSSLHVVLFAESQEVVVGQLGAVDESEAAVAGSEVEEELP